MDPVARQVVSFVLRRWLMLAVAVGAGACNSRVPAQTTQTKAVTIAALTVACEPRDAALNCRALGSVVDDKADQPRETDVTDTAAWGTSNPKTVDILRGRVTANEPGTATIFASVHSGHETLSASVLIVVDKERSGPQVAYDLKGVVRDLSNNGITNVELTLVDDRGHVRTTITREADNPADGAFRFVPLPGGQYRLRAVKQGFRPVERLVHVPDATPLTLVLLFEPPAL